MSAQFFGGVPTKVDVDRLIAKYGIPVEGTDFTFDNLALDVGVGKNTFRFKTVLTAWRKFLFRQHNVLLVAIGGGVLRAANPEERIDYSVRKVNSGRRSIGKAIVVTYQTDQKRLSAESQAAAVSVMAMNDAKMKLAASVMPKG